MLLTKCFGESKRDTAIAPMLKAGILSTIGNTPMIKLERYLDASHLELFAKLEAFNPGGSSKDRPARAIVERAWQSGAVHPATVVVESSSGNMGIGLAQACRYFGLRFICVVDPKASALNVRMMEAFGAEVDRVVEPDPASGEWLPARLARVEALLRQVPGSFWPNQYANAANAEAHYRTTMAEVMDQLDGRVDHLFIPTSTCGTLRGCCEYVRDHRLPLRIVAVDAAGSRIFSEDGVPAGARLIPGLGAGIEPPLRDRGLIHEVVYVTDRDCVRGCRRLVDREAILAGGSSGGVLAAVEKLAGEIPTGARCVAILPDRGERYLDTIFDDAWVQEQLGGLAAPLEAAPRAAGPARAPRAAAGVRPL